MRLSDKKSKFKSEKSRFKKIVSKIEYIIIFIVIFVNAVLVFESVNNPNKTPSIFGTKAFVIISGSMIPSIDIGDVVVVKEKENVQVEDVIAFRRDSSVIVHRVIKEMQINGKQMFQTKGDNNNVADSELVDTKAIEGVMIGKIPFVGYILMWMYNNLSIVIVGIVIILILRYFILKYIIKAKE